jgi:UDP-glucose 4-epimerase
MRTVLVTGGAGFIGSHLVDALVQRGDRVRVVDDFSSGRDSNLQSVKDKIEIVRGDVSDPEIAAKAVQGIEVVFHEAALPSVQLSIERPLDTHAKCATATVALLDQARRAGVRRLVYAASSSAYGDQPTAAKRESDQLMTLSPYAAAKLASEFYCQAFFQSFGFETVCLRYFNVFGPRQDPTSPYSAVIPLRRFMETANSPAILCTSAMSWMPICLPQNGPALVAESSMSVPGNRSACWRCSIHFAR